MTWVHWKILAIPVCALAAMAADAPRQSETWRFDNIDQIGGHATKVIGHPIVVDTSIGKAVLFNGVGDALQVDEHPLAGARAFTLEIIFRPDAGGGPEQRFFHLQERDPKTGQDDDTRMLFELRFVDGRFCMEGFQSSGGQQKGLIDRTQLHEMGVWHHGAVVYDGHTMRKYVDGVLEDSAEIELVPQGAGHTSIGSRINLRSFFKGAVYETRATRSALAPAEFLQVPHFREHAVVPSGLAGGYQVVAADLNHDGKPDLIALSTRAHELVWYENPTWERHVLLSGVDSMINCVAVGADAEGIPDIVLASGFSNVAKNSQGVVSVLRHDGDPRMPWKATEIDRIPTSHRLRVAYFNPEQPVVINAALTGPQAEPPDYRGETPLVYYRPGVWKRETIQPQNNGLTHGILVIDWDRDSHDGILTAGFEGIHLFRMGANGQWSRTKIADGAPEAWPKSGSSDLAVGRLGKERFLAAIEPWHGNEVAIYRKRGAEWERQVIDTSLTDGHALVAADFDGDGNDEVVAGYRGGNHNLYLYRFDAATNAWVRQTLDEGGMGAAACAVADLNGDGRVDVVCIGSATGNLKWYENLGARP